MTGKESVYTVYAGHEVMYHVSTMLPHSKDNPQQLERKRHIGNDIVNIIYSDDPSALENFNPNCIRSQFTRKSIELPDLYRCDLCSFYLPFTFITVFLFLIKLSIQSTCIDIFFQIYSKKFTFKFSFIISKLLKIDHFLYKRNVKSRLFIIFDLQNLNDLK